MLSRLFTGLSKLEWSRLLVRIERDHEKLGELSTKVSTTAGAALLVRINELEAALEALQKSNRKELGRLWKLVSAEPASPPVAKRDTVDVIDDPELAAELALQHAPAVSPGFNGKG